MVLLFFFFAYQFQYKGLTRCCTGRRRRRAAEPELSKRFCVNILLLVLVELLRRWMG